MEGYRSDLFGIAGARDAHVRLGAEHGARIAAYGVELGGLVAVDDRHVSVREAVVEVDMKEARGHVHFWGGELSLVFDTVLERDWFSLVSARSFHILTAALEEIIYNAMKTRSTEYNFS